MQPEDPHVFRDQNGNFHMLFSANSGHRFCASGQPCGGHAWSRDGLSWSPPTIPAFGPIVHYDDGTSRNWGFLERPQVSVDDDGLPVAAFFGQDYQEAHTLAVLLCQRGDIGCVTTIA